MGKKALSGRENWQTESGPGGRAGIAEKDFPLRSLATQTDKTVSLTQNILFGVLPNPY